MVCCIIPGEIDDGGLATRIPVLGFTIGMAFRVRTADGWCSFNGSWVIVNAGGETYAEVAAEDKDIAGVTCWGCICD